MRIFAAVRHSVDPRRFYGGLWSANFYPALRQLGHEIVESQTDLSPTSKFMEIADGFTAEELAARAETTERVLDEVRAAQLSGPVHLFLSYFYNAHFDPAGFDELRRLGIPSVNFYCNSIYQFDLVAAIAAKVDVSWHAERDARASYLAVGARPVWVQMGADPAVCHPVPSIPRQPRACFVGQRYADRDRLAASLVRSSLPLDLYGAGWGVATAAPEAEEEPAVYLGRERLRAGSARAYWRVAAAQMRSGGVARGLERMALQWRYRSETTALSPLLSGAARGRSAALCDTFANYEIVLNFSNVWADGRPGSSLVPHVRLRDFEGPMSRTCYLTGHSDEITAFYDVGREIDTYRAAEELTDKVRYYLAHPPAAEALREAGYRRALCDHTWRRRFEELFSKIGVAA
ncbi:MAG: glycosyltransferase [Acidobacteriota bacterium]|nr:glycosyltransferase [Acidobacteriota bacterium]